ncbi:MAG: AbrB/MazE/SpoVT family DNA-binding domain-containing protein [Leptospira sp.]|jgi:AbrB family looped-hinge helix DNA binding protein|nr:AbrB/MazE/SpoVT family DNA-binding domain-containing protein [Leptospira sp.]
MKVQSKITSKFQVTIPKEIRNHLHLEENHVLEWHVTSSGIQVFNSKKPFLKHQGILRSANKNSKHDIHSAWKSRSEKFR